MEFLKNGNTNLKEFYFSNDGIEAMGCAKDVPVTYQRP